MPAGEAPANKTKTKKLIIFGFFLINIQTGPAGSSALEGERRRRKKPQTKSNRLILYLSLCLSSLYLSLIRGSNSFTLIPKFCKCKSVVTNSCFVLFCFFKVLGWESGHVKKKEAGRRKKDEKKQDRSRGSEKKTEGKREKEKQSKCDAGN